MVRGQVPTESRGDPLGSSVGTSGRATNNQACSWVATIHDGREALRTTNQLHPVMSQGGQGKGPHESPGHVCPDPTRLSHRTAPSGLGTPGP